MCRRYITFFASFSFAPTERKKIVFLSYRHFAPNGAFLRIGKAKAFIFKKMAGRAGNTRSNKQVHNSLPKIIALNIRYFKLFIYLIREVD
jgi:hypothetical protein